MSKEGRTDNRRLQSEFECGHFLCILTYRIDLCGFRAPHISYIRLHLLQCSLATSSRVCYISLLFFSSKFTNQLCSCGTGESVGLIASINSVRCSRGTSQTSTINGASSLCADGKQADTQGKGNGTGRKKRAGAAGWFAMAPIDLGLHTRWTARPGQVSLIILRIREVSRPDRDDTCRWQIGKSASRAVF